MNRDPHLNPLQWHHGYIGAVVFVFGLIGVLAVPGPGVDMLLSGIGGLIGLWLCADDIVQHIVQHYRPGYRSPVNRLWGWLNRIK